MRFPATSLIMATVVSISAMATPAFARHRHHRWHTYIHHTRLGISYSHNYGPGIVPGTFAYYDGPLGARCKQSAAAYLGQDGRAYPCN